MIKDDKYTDKVKEIYENKLLDAKLGGADESDAQWQFLKKYIGERISKEGVLLDAGCGTGKYARSFMRMGFQTIECIDLFDKHTDPDLNYKKASLLDLPYENESFDAIYSTSVIYYLEKPEEGVAELARCLKNNGVLLLTVVTKYSTYTLLRLIKKKIKLKSASHIEPYHFRYTYCSYVKMLKKYGFDIEYIDGFGTGLIFTIVRKLIYIISNKHIIISKKWVSRWKWVGKLKAIFGYHAVIVARKI